MIGAVLSSGVGEGMAVVSYSRHQFPPVVIQQAVWLYLRFTVSYRDVEKLLAERGLNISYETVRRWVLKFGVLFARRLRERWPRPNSQWHLDEMVAVIGGRRMYLWRAVDAVKRTQKGDATPSSKYHRVGRTASSRVLKKTSAGVESGLVAEGSRIDDGAIAFGGCSTVADCRAAGRWAMAVMTAPPRGASAAAADRRPRRRR
jgi:hypothetical protein